MTDQEGKYLGLLNIESPELAVKEIELMVSNISGDHHIIRSIILDLHFAVEVELCRFLFHALKRTILFKDEEEKKMKEDLLYKNVGNISFGVAHKLLEASLHKGPWPDLVHAKAINETRNKMAHNSSLEEVKYKGRSPFYEPDCLAQMYFEVWAFKQEYAKLFWKAIDEPFENLKYYRAAYEEYKRKFGDIDFKVDGKRPLWS